MKPARITGVCLFALFGTVGAVFAGPPRDHPIVSKVLEILCSFLPALKICQ
jgi:hypothetical protein